jgi:hypothetical protein
MEAKSEVLDEVNRQYMRFNAQGTELKVSLLPPPNEGTPDPITHFESSVNALFGYALENIEDTDMVGLVIQNENTQKEKPIGFSFWRKKPLSVEVIWKPFEKVVQSNAKFNALDRLIVTVHTLKMPAGSRGDGLRSKGRHIDSLAHLKRSTCV